MEGKFANKTEQMGENGATMTAECEEGEDYLVTNDEECYNVAHDVSLDLDCGFRCVLPYYITKGVSHFLYEQDHWQREDVEQWLSTLFRKGTIYIEK
jgi:hypothetical protein